MRVLCVYFLLQTASAQVGFGGYLGRSRVCNQWECLHGKFNFTDVLPQKDEYRNFIRGRLPIEWHNTGDNAVEACYQPKETNKYTNTCTGQGLMHCVVDKMIQNCPSVFWNQDDGCARVASIAGNSYMFSQSQFENLRSVQSSLERRQAELFINSYFTSKCCQLPQMFDENVLEQCGFTEVLHYIKRETHRSWAFRNGPSIQDVAPRPTDRTVIGQVYNFHLLPESSTSLPSHAYTTNADDQDDGNNAVQDPLECCKKIDDFIAPDWRSECGFNLRWDSQHRLTNPNYIVDAPRNTTEQCEDLTPATSCVLNKMGLLNRWGFIDHFRMKDQIRAYTNGKLSYLYDVFNSVILNVPRYDDQCDSPRKLFNLLDAMLIVCEPDMRRSTPQCNKMFAEITIALPDNAKEKIDELHNSQRIVSYGVGFLPSKVVLDYPSLNFPVQRYTKTVQESPKSRVQDDMRYDFGVLGLLGHPPQVTTIDLKPRNKTLVLLPVYQRTPKNDPLTLNSLHDDGILRG